MSFDRNNRRHLEVLRDEVATDPQSIGFAAVVSQTQKLLRLLNDAENNTGGETEKLQLTPESLRLAVVISDYAANQMGDARGMIDTYMRLEPGTDLEPEREKIVGAFQSNSATKTALDAQTQALARIEVMQDPASPGAPIYGSGTRITADDWFAARDFL